MNIKLKNFTVFLLISVIFLFSGCAENKESDNSELPSLTIGSDIYSPYLVKNNPFIFVKQNRFFVRLLILVGNALFAGALCFGIPYSLNMAHDTMERDIGDLKKQCCDYSDFLATDETKSLVRLTEHAEGIGTDLPLLAENVRNDFLKQYCDSQRLDCVLLLDGNLKPDLVYSPIAMRYGDWKDEIALSAVSAILDMPKKFMRQELKKTA